MAQLPTIFTIQASGARQHGGKLEEILQTLKTEHRITDYTTLGPDVALAKLKEQVKADDMVLMLLTQELEPQKEPLEDKLSDLTTAQPDIKVAEIIVDKVVYGNKFITFPADLRPIRDREDMDAVWDSIEQSLKDMFPAQKKEEPVPDTPTDWSKYLKIAGVFIALLVVFFVIKGFVGEDDGKDETEVLAGFTVNPTACKAPCKVLFENTSKNANGYNWDFGDGVKTSETTPSHTFNTAGSYTVKLIAYRGEQRAEQTQGIEVSTDNKPPPEPPRPVANFLSSTTSCEAPCGVDFSNASQNADTYRWDFGDGATSSKAAPSHVFSKPGSYTVTLLASGGGQSAKQTQGITVSPVSKPKPEPKPPRPVADFKISKTSCEAPCRIDFKNESQNADTYSWNFGDGTTSSKPNPSHAYKKAGNYTVRLIAKSGNQQDNKSISIRITSKFTVTGITASVGGSANVTGRCPHNVSFKGKISTNKAGTVKYTWRSSIGKSAPEQTLNFSKAGSKTVSSSWNLGVADKIYKEYWQELIIIAPTKMLSNRAVFNLNCINNSVIYRPPVIKSKPPVIISKPKVPFPKPKQKVITIPQPKVKN